MCIFSFFRKIKIERNTKLKLIAYILGITCYNMSLIEAPKLVSIKQKRKKRAVESGRIIFRPTVHGYINKAAMVDWLRCSIHIHKILCSNLSIIIHGMTLDKSLTAKLSRMSRSRTVHQLVRWTEESQIPPSVKRKRS